MPTAKQTGKWGEQLTVDYLISEGYAIEEVNWQLGHLEIDIVASKGNDICFVEVKTRRNMDEDPAAAVDRRKISHIVSAARAYLNQMNIPDEARRRLLPRFDIAAINGDQHSHTFRYLPDAFRPRLRTY